MVRNAILLHYLFGADVMMFSGRLVMHLVRAVQQELKEISDESRQKSRKQIINAVVDDIRALAPLVEDVLKDNYICIVGSQGQIEKNKALFSGIIKV